LGNRGLEEQEKKELTAVEYAVSLIFFIDRKIDAEYYELLSKAIEYGMKPNEFWNDDIQNFYCYQVAYINKTYDNAYTIGYYNYIAFTSTMAGMFAKRGEKAPEYPRTNIYNPLNEKRLEKPTNEFKGHNSKGLKKLFHIKRFIDKEKEVK